MMTAMINTSAIHKLLLSLLMTACLWLVLPVADVYAVTLKQAVSQVERQYDGKVVSARTVNRNGQRVHIIRVVTRDGVVKTVHIPE